jgi:hypothetical protein
MSTVKITLNGEKVAFNCFAAGADVCPGISINHDAWPNYVVVDNVTDYTPWHQVMLDVFTECEADTTKITFETI